MKRYLVSMCYTFYQDFEIEAEDEAKARQAAFLAAHIPTNVSGLRIWKDVDSIEEIKGKPADGDYIISSCGPFLSATMVSIVGGGGRSVVFTGEDQDDRVRTYVKGRMEKEKFYPTVWIESDHGNFETISIWDEEDVTHGRK